MTFGQLPFHIGDKVYDTRDPRHVGEVRSIKWSVLVKVCWDETGWISFIPTGYLRKAEI